MLDQLSPSRVVFSPMVGISHFAIRKALSEYLPVGGKALWPTEMLSSRRIPNQKMGQSIETLFLDSDNGLCPQLLGNEESFIQPSVRKLEDWGARAIDINMGCPVKKALQHNYGVSLMGDVDYAARIVDMTVKHTKLPVSVKLRAGMGDAKGPEFLLKFTLALQNAGASWLTLHPRLAEQKRRGNADWSQIKFLKDHLKIPIIGNGDIQTADDIQEMFKQTGCDRVMIGRALLAKPWLMKGVDPMLSSFDQGAEYGRFLRRVLHLMRFQQPQYEENQGMRRLRFLVYHGSVWLTFGHTLYSKMKGAVTYDDADQVLIDFFTIPQAMTERTELRG